MKTYVTSKDIILIDEFERTDKVLAYRRTGNRRMA